MTSKSYTEPNWLLSRVRTEALSGMIFVPAQKLTSGTRAFRYRQILVYIFCLISIGLSLSDEANKMQFLNIERA